MSSSPSLDMLDNKAPKQCSIMSKENVPIAEGSAKVKESGIYVGFANLPNQVHRKSVKKGFEFTLMVVGESGLGKSTLVDSLFLTNLYIDRNPMKAAERIKKTVQIQTSTVEIEEKGVRLKLTVVDTPGFGDAVDNSESWEPILAYVDKQYEAYLRDESGLNRRNIVDNRVHCCLYFVNPIGHGLKPLDVKFMKALHNKVNIVPVIAKADTLTKKEVADLKSRILKEVQQNEIHIYQFPDADDEDDDVEFIQVNKELKESIPFAVVGSNMVYDVSGKKVRGRMYPWGVVDIENASHCDFTMLRNMLIRTHMQDLKDVTQDIHYENFRAQKLASGNLPAHILKSEDRRKRQSGLQDERDVLLMEKEAEDYNLDSSAVYGWLDQFLRYNLCCIDQTHVQMQDERHAASLFLTLLAPGHETGKSGASHIYVKQRAERISQKERSMQLKKMQDLLAKMQAQMTMQN